MHLFLAGEPLEFVTMDIFGPFPKTVQCNQYMLVITNRYFMLTRPVSTSKTTAAHVANVFMDYWFFPYGIKTYLFTDNRIRFVSKFLTTVCALYGAKHLATTGYYRQANGQTE